MGRIFDIDSPLMRGLTKFADVMWLNILTLIFALPLLIEQMFLLGPAILPTMFDGAEFDRNYFLNALLWAWLFGIICSSIFGPACTAMHYVLLKIVRDEEGYITKGFFKSYKENFKQAFVLQILKFAIGGMLVMDFLILQNAGTVLRYGIFAVGFYLYIVGLYIFPLLSRFDNTTLVTIKNAFLVSILALPKSLAMAVVSIVPIIVLYFFDIKAVPVLVLLGIAGPSYLNAHLYNGTFKRFEPEEEQTSDDQITDEEG